MANHGKVRKMNVKVKVYDMNKWRNEAEKVSEVEYNNIQGFEVVTGDKATEIGNKTDGSSRDDFNEYLVITLADGQKATFRNSRVDVFKI